MAVGVGVPSSWQLFGRGRPCDLQRQTPAVQSHMANRDTYAQCQTVHVGLVIDRPVVVHVKVVDNTVVAQRPFPLVQPSRPLRFSSCSSLTWCSTSRCAGPADSSGAGGEETFEIPLLQHVEAWTLWLTCPLCATTDAGWCRKLRMSRSCSTF